MSDSHADWHAWIDRHCICATCIHGVDRDLFDVFCDREDSMAGGWNPGTACCEEHDFSDPALKAEFDRLGDAWYEATYGGGKLEQIMRDEDALIAHAVTGAI